MATYERLDYGSPDGSHWGGSSSDALGMYGVTPVTQYGSVGAASTYTVASTSNAVQTTFGFTSSGITSIIHQVSSITVAGRRLGLWL